MTRTAVRYRRNGRRPGLGEGEPAFALHVSGVARRGGPKREDARAAASGAAILLLIHDIFLGFHGCSAAYIVFRAKPRISTV